MEIWDLSGKKGHNMSFLSKEPEWDRSCGKRQVYLVIVLPHLFCLCAYVGGRIGVLYSLGERKHIHENSEILSSVLI